jgi:hypothetical protein
MWLKNKTNREIAVIVIPLLVAIIGGGWTMFAYFYPSEKNNTIEVTYRVCSGSLCRNAPGEIKIACDSSVADWAKKECAKYELSNPTRTQGNDCNDEAATVKCTSKR